MSNNTFDHIVIGAGSAGCVVAGRLSEATRGSICVLEAGPPDRNPFIHIPAGVMYTLHNPAINWLYMTEASEATGGRQIRQPRGKTLGGSGAINGHIYNRGHRLDYDDWESAGNPGWAYADVLPWFRRSEQHLGSGAADFHGSEGPFTITDIDERDPVCDAFIAGATNLGIAHNPDYNGEVQDGIAYAQRSVHRGRRSSPARAFLYPAMKRGNTDVRTNAHVQRILIENNRAVGVQYIRDGETHTVRARGDIVLSGGSIASPQILQMSGIGNPDHLGAIGVPVTHALRGVGENLRDHYVVRLVAKMNTPTVNQRVRGLALVREVLRYATTRRGALAMTPTALYAFLKSSPDLDRSDMQITFTPASYPDGVQSKLDDFPGVTIACWQQQPRSSGYVRARSADPFEHPEIQPNYLSHPDDRETLLKALRASRRLINAEPFASLVESEYRPGENQTSDEELMAYASQNGHSAYHPMGSCRMGPVDAPNTVVDAKLRVHGIAGLRVADASIMPDMICANTNAACLMIGERAADFILSD